MDYVSIILCIHRWISMKVLNIIEIDPWKHIYDLHFKSKKLHNSIYNILFLEIFICLCMHLF